MIPCVSVPAGESGDWRIERFSVSEDEARLDNLRAIFSTTRRRGIAPGEYTRLLRGSTVVMSDTPDEKSDHFEAVRNACGRVLINGLGLGMVLNAILLKPEVTNVTVIEKSEDVIRLVAPTYGDPRVKIELSCAFDYRPDKGSAFDVVWHDIWDYICSDNLEEMKTLHRRYGRRCGWQGSWARELCEYHARRGR